jgi:hypothetical protein
MWGARMAGAIELFLRANGTVVATQSFDATWTS